MLLNVMMNILKELLKMEVYKYIICIICFFNLLTYNMTEYDIDIDNYTEYELLRILKIKEEINTLSIQQLNDHIDKIIIKLKSNEEYNLIGFIKLAGEKLQKSLIKKHDIIENNNPYPLVQHTQPSAVNTTQTYYPKGVINPIDKKTITKVINIDTIFREN